MRAAVIAYCCWYLMKVFITGDVLVWIWLRGMFCWRRVRDQKKKLDQTSASIKAESRSVMCRYVCTTLCSEAFIPYFYHMLVRKNHSRWMAWRILSPNQAVHFDFCGQVSQFYIHLPFLNTRHSVLLYSQFWKSWYVNSTRRALWYFANSRWQL